MFLEGSCRSITDAGTATETLAIRMKGIERRVSTLREHRSLAAKQVLVSLVVAFHKAFECSCIVVRHPARISSDPCIKLFPEMLLIPPGKSRADPGKNVTQRLCFRCFLFVTANLRLSATRR